MAEEKIGLAGYSTQQLQLELIRRCKFAKASGDELVQFLLEQQALWMAVMLDEIEFRDFYESRPILMKLGKIEKNIWNPDTLYLMSKDETSARQLVELGAEKNFWEQERTFIYDQRSSCTILGSYHKDDIRVLVINLR